MRRWGGDVGGLPKGVFRPGDHRIRSLAVLPLENLSGDPSKEYVADGMTEALITDLGKIGSLRVIARSSVMGFRGDVPLSQIARQLRVDGLVVGR